MKQTSSYPKNGENQWNPFANSQQNLNPTTNSPEPKKKKVHNYEKILTNPKDKKLDVESCGSFYLKDWELGNDEIAKQYLKENNDQS